MRKSTTRQAVLIHISDVHFGSKHTFDPPQAVGGGSAPAAGRPSLLELLLKDLDRPDPGCPVLICVTGDLTTINSQAEYRRAETFVQGLAGGQVFGQVRGTNSIFVIPGNHDVDFEGDDFRQRLTNWFDFENRLYGTQVRPEEPYKGVCVHDLIDSAGVVVVRVNSAAYVRRGSPEETRGSVDEEQLGVIEEQLMAIPAERLESAIRIALVHHHPILIPQLAEPGRGYDAIQNAGLLLSLLRKHEFHLVLHGHKHDPYIFSEDSRPGFARGYRNPMVVAAGGSAGSSELPTPNRRNCYNLIQVKWHPSACQTRVVIETRSLVTHVDGHPLLGKNWHWETLLQEDRHFLGGRSVPRNGGEPEPYDAERYTEDEQVRKNEYSRLRGNLPVAEVRPSLIPGQAYEAVLWIQPHWALKPHEIPDEVTWSAGPLFETVTIPRKDDEHFCVRFDYWGGFLAQARLSFADGSVEHAHVYARLPTTYPEP
jgi:3',5'-cyclic AMP phosphodiesterase CpdA